MMLSPENINFCRKYDCLEERSRKFYCDLFGNLSCPKICSYANKKVETNLIKKREEIQTRISNGK